MKTLKVLFIICLGSTNLLGQVSTEPAATAPKSDIKRSGFYFSTALGGAGGSIGGSDNMGNNLSISGTAVSWDFQIGGSVADNLFLHGTLGIKSISSPTVNGVKLTSNYSFDENFIGIGMTRYFKNNFLITANLGSAKMAFTQNNTSINTNGGFSGQFKVGKEWWLSQRWLLGVSGQYSFSSITNKPGGGVEEKWNSNRFGIMLNATMIKYRNQ